MKINNKMSRVKIFSKSICHCETQQSQRMNYLKEREPISLLLALTIILSLFLVALPMAGTAEASTDVSGEITSDTTWDVAGSPYIITDDVTVDAGVTLTIEAGVRVKFNDAIGLICNGTLLAEGTVSEQITFTSNEATPMAGDWQGLIFGTTAVNSVVENCVIEYAHNGVHVDWSTITEAKTSPVTIKNSTFQNIAYRGVNFTGKDDGGSTHYYNPVEHIVITGNEFIDVGKLGAGSNPMAIFTRSVRDVDISNNLFLRGEGTYFAYLGVACEDYVFENNIIRDPGYTQGIHVSIAYTNIKGGIPIISGNKFEGTAIADNFRCIFVQGHDGLVVTDNEFYTGSSGVYLLWFGGEGGDLIEGNLFDGVGTGNDDSFAIVDSLTGGYTGTVEIRNNIIKNTNGIGVWATPGNQGTCIIEGNDVESNTVGIRVGTDSWDVDTASAHFNTIVDNGVGLERIGTVSEPFNATQNWWGAANGPTHASNPNGTGDAVSDNVDYDPWYIDAARKTLSNEAGIISYKFEAANNTALTADVIGAINSTDHTVSLTVPYGIDVTALVASFDLSAGATAKVGETAQVSGITANDFSSLVTYTITSLDETTQDWTVTVNITPPSNDATLSDLTVDETTIAGFDPSTLIYNEVLPYGTTEVPTVAATTSDPNATTVITQATNLTGTEAERTATVVVTAEDGTTTETYKVIFGSIKVTITKTGLAQANQGDNIAYTITYKNVGTFNATNVVITETYPSEVEFISSDPAPDTGTNNKWKIGTLGAGGEGTIEVTVKIK